MKGTLLRLAFLLGDIRAGWKNSAKDKHSSFLQKNDGRKKFNNIGPWGQSYKTFYGRYLRIFVIS
jgi:hypothetical protein